MHFAFPKHLGRVGACWPFFIWVLGYSSLGRNHKQCLKIDRDLHILQLNLNDIIKLNHIGAWSLSHVDWYALYFVYFDILKLSTRVGQYLKIVFKCGLFNFHLDFWTSFGPNEFTHDYHYLWNHNNLSNLVSSFIATCFLLFQFSPSERLHLRNKSTCKLIAYPYPLRIHVWIHLDTFLYVSDTCF